MVCMVRNPGETMIFMVWYSVIRSPGETLTRMVWYSIVPLKSCSIYVMVWYGQVSWRKHDILEQVCWKNRYRYGMVRSAGENVT